MVSDDTVMRSDEEAGGRRDKQPNSRQCFVCGLENPVGLRLAVYTTAPGEVSSEYTAPDHFQGYPGVVHGGIVASMLDEVVGRAVMGDDTSRFMMTARLQVRYRLPVPVGQPLRLEGKMRRRRGRTAEATARLRLPDDTIAAEAEALLVELTGMPAEQESLEALGWKVYPDSPDAARG